MENKFRVSNGIRGEGGKVVTLLPGYRSVNAEIGKRFPNLPHIAYGAYHVQPQGVHLLEAQQATEQHAAHQAGGTREEDAHVPKTGVMGELGGEFPDIAVEDGIVHMPKICWFSRTSIMARNT